MRRGIGRLRAGGSGFNLLSLFAAGEQGGWYDPSDSSAMYQDSLGTTAAAVESPVGLVLDKRLGLVRGPELVSNGSAGFTTTTGWTPFSGATTLSAVSGSLRVQIASGINADGYTSFTTVVGKSYEVLYTVSGITATTVKMMVGTAGGSPAGGGQDTASATLGSRRIIVAATATTTFLTLEIAGSVGQYVDASIVSCKLLDGNHLIQATAASRPTLSARYNGLTKSEVLSNAAWTPTQVTAVSGGTGPTGSAATLLTMSVLGDSFVAQSATGITATTAGAVLYVALMANTVTNSSVGVYDPSGSGWAGAVGTAQIISGPGSVAANAALNLWDVSGLSASQWTIVKITRTAAAFTAVTAQARIYPGLRNIAVVGNSVYVGYADCRSIADVALNIPAYQRVDTASSYDTSGFPMYLLADGVDDGMASAATVDFSATSNMCFWLGTSKQSDVSGMILETSVDASTNVGSFYCHMVSAGLIGLRVRGSGDNYRTFTGFGTTVVSGALTTVAADSASAMAVKFNGVTNAGTNSITAASAGNFGNYTLYVARRAGASTPYNGRIYQLIIRGAASTAAQIASTETFVGAKQGIAL